jgi:hypothetical protein
MPSRSLHPLHAKSCYIVFAVVALGVLTSTGCARKVKEAKDKRQVQGSTAAPTSNKTLNVKDFGAKGDGIADDYDALQAAGSALCRSAGATLVFPEGTYLINRKKIGAGPSQNSVQNVRYVGCQGSTITGVRATIEVRGDFRRRADKNEGSYAISYTDSVIPFEMIDSSGFRIIGFDIEGDVEKMSRDPKVAVGSAAGVSTTRCQNYFIENVTVRGVAGDGIRLGDDSQSSDTRVHVVNVSSTQNARQGLAIINVRGADVVNSVFSNNGRTGAYGSHAPAAGVAIDPVRYTSHEDPTGGITFDKCRFEETLGSQFLSERPDLVDSLTIKNSYVTSTLPDTRATAFISTAKVGTVQGSTFDVSARHSVALAGYSPDLYRSLSRLVYRNNTFHLGDNKGLIAPLQPAPIEFVANNIRVESEQRDSTLLRLDYLKLAENNFIFEANSGYSGVHPTILYEKGNETIRNNTYDTDRTEQGYFDVYYGPDVVVSGEIFRNADHFKRYYSAVTR